MTDLLVTAHTPALGTGRAMRTYGVVAALARSGPVELAYVPFGEAEPSAEYRAMGNVMLRPLDPTRGPARAMAYARALGRGVPEALARAVSPALQRSADGAGDDVRVIADGPSVAAALLPLAEERPVVHLAHNLESGFRHTPALERFERRVLGTFVESWLPTRADMRGAVELGAPAGAVRHVPNVVDVQAITPAAGHRGSMRVLLVADFTYEPNRDGLEHLARDVMPLVWEQEPEAHLVVAGRGPADPPADARIEVRGFVDDLEAVYAGADAVAVPMRHGGGSPLKFVEALAHGIPVVATAHAAALLEEGEAGRDFLAAPDAAAFADALVLALRGGAQAQAAAGRTLAERAYSVDALAGMLAR